MDVATSAVVAQQSSTRAAFGTAMLKQQHKAEMSIAAMLEEVSRSAPQPGQGTIVDITA